MTPDWGWPSSVTVMTGDNVKVKLWHDVADRCGVDLVGAGVRLQPSPETGGKRHQPLLVDRAEVM